MNIKKNIQKIQQSVFLRWSRTNEKNSAYQMGSCLLRLFKNAKKAPFYCLMFYQPLGYIFERYEKLKLLSEVLKSKSLKNLKSALNKWRDNLRTNNWFTIGSKKVALMSRINRQVAFWRMMNQAEIPFTPFESINVSRWSVNGTTRLINLKGLSITPVEGPSKNYTPDNDSFHRNYLGNSFDQSMSIHILEPPQHSHAETMAQLAQRGSLSLLIDKVTNMEKIKLVQGFERLKFNMEASLYTAQTKESLHLSLESELASKLMEAQEEIKRLQNALSLVALN